jgi:hypothetical protein
LLAESSEIVGNGPAVSSSPVLGKGVGDHLDELARERRERPASDSQQALEPRFMAAPVQ